MSYKYTYTKEVVLGRLEQEIEASSVIVHALDYMTSLDTTVDIYFKAELSSEEVTELNAIVAAHVPTPLPAAATLVEINEPKDDHDRIYVRQVATIPEFHYTPRSLDFYTAKYNSLYNRSHFHDPNNTTTGGTIDGSLDFGDGALKFYDATHTELTKGAEESDEDFQTRLTANCTKTVLEFEPTFDYDIFGAKVQFKQPASLGETDRAYFWFVAAPDIPAEYGGNVVFLGGGFNISFFGDKAQFECDGKTVSRIPYDSQYHSGKVALIVKHNVGIQIGLQLILQFYSE